MPVSHIGLTVSHLPTSCSFFLSALQPLGYRFIGQQGNQIGLGIEDADFFLCQETPGTKAGAAHIAFTALSRTAVRDFYTAALTAGGRPNGSPSTRNEETGYFNAAVLDFDGNSIEVVFRNEPDMYDDGTVIEHSRVITWQKSVSESVRDDVSVASASTVRSSRKALTPAMAALSVAPSAKAQSVVSKASNLARSISAPVTVTTTTTHTSSISDGSAKKLLGTLLGAAAGAAVAYAMVKSEGDSAKAEAQFSADQASRAQPAQQIPVPQPMLSFQEPQPIYESPPRSVHRNISETDSYYSTAQHAPRAIEAPPARSFYASSAIDIPQARSSYAPSVRAPSVRAPSVHASSVHASSVHASSVHASSVHAPSVIEASSARSYHAPTYASVPPTQVPERRSNQTIDYVQGSSPASHNYTYMNRSVSSPSAIQQAKSKAPSTLISSYAPTETPRPGLAPSDRRSSTGSTHSHKSKAKSHVSSASKQSKTAGSVIGSILGREHIPGLISEQTWERDSSSTTGSESERPRSKRRDDDTDTVVPSDSISSVGSSSRSRHHSKHSSSGRSHHSRSGDSTVSKHSKHSSSSKHSKKSSRSSRYDEADIVRPSTISEASDASTVKPSKRKDSGVSGIGANDGGWGSVASLPVRGITESMINGEDGSKGRKKSVVG